MAATRPTVLYDEDCGFCTWVADWLARHGELEVAAIGSERGARLLRDLAHRERYASVHVVDAHGRRASAGGSLGPILRALPHGGPVARLVDAFPGLADWGYGLVARRRSAIGGLLRVRPLGSRATRASRARAG